MSDSSLSRPALNAHDLARIIGDRLRRLYGETKQEPLRAMVRAAHADAEARNAGALKASPVACKAGCAFCCHQQVSATAAEILIIARRMMNEKPGIRARLRSAVRKADAASRGLNPLQRWAQRQPCPLLGPDNLCSVYEDRPFSCRGYASSDVEACRHSFETAATSSPHQIPRPEALRLNATMLSYALEVALQNLGLAHRAYDLNHGLGIALEVGPRAALARYREGEDVLAPARLPRPPAQTGAGA